MAKRLLWWLRHGQSCERWFQFEWAYRLESVLESEFPEAYSVGCERNFVDIVIYQKSFKSSIPLYQSNVSAGIEIKWCGNWSAANSITETEKDLRKIRENIKYNYPALALSAWIFATPAEKNDPLYSWVAKQIKAEKVDQRTLKEKLTSLGPDIETRTYTIIEHPKHPFDFGKLEMFCIGFYNDKAKSQIMDHH